MITIKAFQALCGDCLLLTYHAHNGSDQHIIIDAGYAQTYHRTLAPAMRELRAQQQSVTLFILTHVDNDHIGGVLPFLKDFGTDYVDQFWLNHSPMDIPLQVDGPVSIQQGITLAQQLGHTGKLNVQPILTGERYSFGDGMLLCLSPDKDQYERLLIKWEAQLNQQRNEPQLVATPGRDYDIPIEELVKRPFQPDTSWCNRSSLALLVTVSSFNGLFLGDAHADVVATSLRQAGYTEQRPLQLNFVKVAHHGSRSNTSEALLRLLDCQHFLISTNGSNAHGLPHKEALARIVTAAHHRRPHEPVHLYFTYDDPFLRTIFTEAELTNFAIHCHYPSIGGNALIFTHHDPS